MYNKINMQVSGGNILEENKSLNNKYQSIGEEDFVTEEFIKEEKPKKEKVKKEKAPKEKKVKAPKEKKIKEPKPPKEKKEKKEKKVKEPKPPKEKKVKEPKKSLFAKEEKTETIKQDEIIAREVTPEMRRTEEVVLPTIKSVKKVSEDKPKKEKVKKVKEPKQAKEKKAKEPKPQKEKKIKEPKQPKPKKEKVPKAPKEKKEREKLNKKDFITMGVAVFAVLMIALVVGFNFFAREDLNVDTPESTTVGTGEKLSDVQISRGAVKQNIVQSDISDVFFGFSESDYTLQYYQYTNDKMTAVKSNATVKTSVNMGNEDIPVSIDYIKLGDRIFGMGLFKADQNQEVYFYKMLVFKLVNLPKGYEQEGKALLLATESKNALTQKDILWTESFVLDLNTGKTERFLKITNRTISMSGAGVADFCMLTSDGYNSTSGQIPFISGRKYELNSGKQDIFVKNGAKEDLLISDVYGKFLLMDGNDIIFMRKNGVTFDVVRLTNGEEKVIRNYPGSMSSDYLLTDHYIFNKETGMLYDLLTGEEKLVAGYRISAEMVEISPDGKYLVMLGTVKNMMDYQIHIFNLATGDYSAYEDKNYSKHSNLAFINNTTAVYVVVDPNQGYESVAVDVSKAF